MMPILDLILKAVGPTRWSKIFNSPAVRGISVASTRSSELRAVFEHHVFSEDEPRLAHALGRTLIERGISIATAGRHWAYARAWLYEEISQRG